MLIEEAVHAAHVDHRESPLRHSQPGCARKMIAAPLHFGPNPNKIKEENKPC